MPAGLKLALFAVAAILFALAACAVPAGRVSLGWLGAMFLTLALAVP